MSEHSGNEVMRLFIAIGLGDEVRRNLQRALARLKSSGAHARWTPTENLHLSLIFLGDVPVPRQAKLSAIEAQAQTRPAPSLGVGAEARSTGGACGAGLYDGDKLGRVLSALDWVAARTEAFELAVSGLGAFGRPGRPRVVWAGVADCKPLLRLHADLSASLQAELGVEPERRAYTPHITLGRVKSSRGCQSLQEEIARQAHSEYGRQRVESVQLFQSTLTPAGARHRLLHNAGFKNS
jgi:RNA 2',3'-cyclic 3'-phosphodiesterase